MIYLFGLVIMLIGAKIASIDVENTDLPNDTPVVLVGAVIMLIGYLFIASDNISDVLEKELFSPVKTESIF